MLVGVKLAALQQPYAQCPKWLSSIVYNSVVVVVHTPLIHTRKHLSSLFYRTVRSSLSHAPLSTARLQVPMPVSLNEHISFIPTIV